MVDKGSSRLASGDEGNTAFGLPRQLAARKPGHNRASAREETASGTDDEFPVSAEKDVPREPLAYRIANARKEGR